MYVFILQQDNTQNIMPEGQQGPEALTAARNKNVSNKYQQQLTICRKLKGHRFVCFSSWLCVLD